MEEESNVHTVKSVKVMNTDGIDMKKTKKSKIKITEAEVL